MWQTAWGHNVTSSENEEYTLRIYILNIKKHRKSSGVAPSDGTDPKAFRGIQIGSSLCKILVIVILERLRKWHDSNLIDEQQGFRSGRGTTDGIYHIYMINTSRKYKI